MKSSFAKRTIIIILLTCIVPLSILIVYFFNVSSSMESRRISESLELITVGKADTMSLSMRVVEHGTEDLGEAVTLLDHDATDVSVNTEDYTRNSDGVLEGPSTDESSIYLPPNIELSEDIEKQIVSTEALVPKMKQILAENSEISCAYVVTKDGLMRVFPYIDNDSFDNNLDQRTESFYTVAAKDNLPRETRWTKAYYDHAGHGWIVTCSTPYYIDGEFSGVVCLDVALSYFTDDVTDLHIGDSGYAFIIEGDSGNVIYHPDINKQSTSMGTVYDKTYLDIYGDDGSRKALLASMNTDSNGVVNLTYDNMDYIVAFSKISGLDWVVGIEVSKNDYADYNGYVISTVFIFAVVVLLLSIVVSIVISHHLAQEIIFRERDLTQKEKLAEVGQAVAGITHELKNPLFVIKGATYLLKGGQNIPDYQEILAEIEENLSESEAIIDDMLDFSKTSSEPEMHDAKKIIEQLLLLFRQKCVGQKIVVNISEEEGCGIYGLGDSFKHIFINVISNAVDAMENGGTLDIEIVRAEGGRTGVVFTNDITGTEAVTDNAKMFEPFWTTKKSGTGLGMWIVKRETERNNGRVGAEIAQGRMRIGFEFDGGGGNDGEGRLRVGARNDNAGCNDGDGGFTGACRGTPSTGRVGGCNDGGGEEVLG
ncbi:MAG: sensor histidine kinase, partial [Clostridiales Family XIII bacterium]|nr:sensor histidine kinase [Clostridiales Family XIII bacterium]